MPRRLLALGLSCLLGGLLVEVGVRVLLDPPRYHRSPLELDRTLGFRTSSSIAYPYVSTVSPGTSHVVRFNRDGFRGRPLPEAPAGERARRIVFLGDSFVVAEAVPESRRLTERVEQALTRPLRPVEVYGLGTVDYGTGQELLLLDRIGSRIAPDTVVLVLYPQNDIVNNAFELAGVTSVSPGDAIRPYVRVLDKGRTVTRWPMPLRSFLRRHLESFAQVELLVSPPDLGRRDPRSPGARMDAGLLPREFLEVYRAHAPSDPWEKAWRDTEALLRALRARCDTLEARLLVLVVPSIYQVVQTAQRVGFEVEARARGGSLSDWIDWNLPQRRLAAFFEGEGIDARFLVGPLREATRAGGEMYTRDLHLSDAGHAVATPVVLEALGGAAGARPIATPDSGGPVAWPQASDPTWLDLRQSPHASHLSDGWLAWRPKGPVHPGGWRIGLRGVIALRASPGRLVVRGHALAPVTVDLGFVGGGPRRVLQVSEAGAFEVVLPADPRPVESEDGHVAVFISVGAAVGRIIVQELGFVDDES